MKNRIKLSVSLLLTLCMVGILTACSSSLTDSVKQDAIRFYTSFVQEATSLDPDAVRTAYSDLEKLNLKGQQTDDARDQIFTKFNELNPDLFDKLSVEDASYDVVGATYFNIILMSLNTNGTAVDEVIPTSAVTWDSSTGIYSIDRTQITAPVPVMAESLVTNYEGALPPIQLKKDINGWHIIPDKYMLYEIGVPSTDVK